MAEPSDYHQNRPRISVEEWLAATESEYQETARQVGESLMETQLGQKHIAEKKLSIVRTDHVLATFSAAKRDKIFAVWRLLWLLSNLWGIAIFVIT